MNFETFTLLLLVVSVLTGLFTEGIKKFLQERNKTYYSNALAGYVSLALSLIVSVGYFILAELSFNAKMAVWLIALVLLSWLGSMVGYDKVIQTITQFKSNKDE